MQNNGKLLISEVLRLNISKVIKLIQDNIDNINKPEFISNILNMHNNLICFDSLNRILIQLQYEDAFDLRSYEEWEDCGRKVVSGSNPIWVVSPQYEHTYVYGDNEDKEADISDLNIVEKNKALELNIIKRKSNLKDIKTIAVYDIRQTKKIPGQKYEVAKPILNSKSLIKLFIDITGCKVEICDGNEYFYSASDNELFIPNVQYKEFANMIAKALVKYFLEIVDTSDYSEEDINYIELYSEYSLNTLFRCRHIETLESHSDISKLIQIISIVDSIMEKVINKIEYSGQIDTTVGAVQKVDILRKAEVVLDIFTAVSTNIKIGSN